MAGAVAVLDSKQLLRVLCDLVGLQPTRFNEVKALLSHLPHQDAHGQLVLSCLELSFDSEASAARPGDPRSTGVVLNLVVDGLLRGVRGSPSCSLRAAAIFLLLLSDGSHRLAAKVRRA